MHLSHFKPAKKSILKRVLSVLVDKQFLSYNLNLVGVLTLLVILLPLFIMICLVIMILSPGKAIMCEVKIGFRGRIYNEYYFRTSFQQDNEIINTVNGYSDKRSGILRKGNNKLFNKFSSIIINSGLSKLPKIINVIRGDMAIFGLKSISVIELLNASDVDLSNLPRPGMFIKKNEENSPDYFSLYKIH
jgi:lipopolysaccharide/colanic/teichoic acid biosynthesis glycosyltransferase